MRDDLAVGLALEVAARRRCSLLAQRLEILDDAVVDQRDRRRRCADGRCRRSARRASPSGCGRCRSSPRSGSAASSRARLSSLPSARRRSSSPSIDRADAGGVIAAIFEPPAARRTAGCATVRVADDADDSAHAISCCLPGHPLAEALRPAGLPLCSPRATASASASTSSVMTDPAPTIAPAPIVTGATSAVFEPMKAPSPILVRYLKKPS